MSAVETVASTWPTVPDWVEALAEECDASSQKRAGDRVGYSATTINQVLQGRYKGDLRAVERAVRDTLMRATLICPVVGEISGTLCRGHQAAPYSANNPTRIALFRGCRNGCAHSRLGDAGDAP